MHRTAVEPKPETNQESEPIRVWIENERGDIARGSMVLFSADEALVRLTSADWMTSGSPVAVRIAPSRNTPTLAVSACVLRVRPIDQETECELEWAEGGVEREQLAMLVAALS